MSAQQHSRPRRLGRLRIPSWFWSALAFAFIGTLFLSAYLIYATIRDATANQEIFYYDVDTSDLPPLVTSEPGVTPVPQELARWSGHERVNVLLLGIDEREHEEGPWRTDTMMVLTLDPVTMSAGMLSIPRDLWVTIAGYGEYNRINMAHFYGDAWGYPGGGPALARDTVTLNLGIPIHFYVRANFAAFETFVDEIGGIDIYIPETIDDPYYPDDNTHGYAPFYIEAGQQHLDGKTALKYARTRITFGGDFDRGQRQQVVILAVRDRVVRLDQLPRLITRAPTLINTLGDAVRTNMSLDQIVQLARLASEIDPGQIVSAVLDFHYTTAQETPDGSQVLVLNRESMRGLRDLIFSEPRAGESVDTAEQLAEENARIIVLNGSDVVGLAGRTRDYLVAQGFQVVEIGDANTDSTLIVDYADKRHTSKHLATVLHLPLSTVISDSFPEGDYDVMLILGVDFELPEG
jgi:LCP family protein required for cell wall assembly